MLFYQNYTEPSSDQSHENLSQVIVNFGGF